MAGARFFLKKIFNYNSESSIVFRLRKRRAELLVFLIEECYSKYGKVNIIDIGGTITYWKIFSREFLVSRNVHITLVNLSSRISLPKDCNLFSYSQGDGCYLEKFADSSFHIAHSNSVLEHVGADFVKRKMFAREIHRVAKVYFVQTPNFGFPIEPHFVTPFFHWLPESIQIKLILNFSLGWKRKANSIQEAKEKLDSCKLLRLRDLKKLFPEANVYKERIAFFIKSFVLINNDY